MYDKESTAVPSHEGRGSDAEWHVSEGEEDGNNTDTTTSQNVEKGIQNDDTVDAVYESISFIAPKGKLGLV